MYDRVIREEALKAVFDFLFLLRSLSVKASDGVGPPVGRIGRQTFGVLVGGKRLARTNELLVSRRAGEHCINDGADPWQSPWRTEISGVDGQREGDSVSPEGTEVGKAARKVGEIALHY
jgi:hypothetical protein